MTHRPCSLALVSLLLLAWPACAQCKEVELSGNVGVVSDYRFRGISYSDREPVIQGGVDLQGERVFVGAWASGIADAGGADTEVDLYGGFQGSMGNVAWTLAANAYFFPGGQGQNYMEFSATGERSVGALTIGLSGALAPTQKNVDEANFYLNASSVLDASNGWALTTRAGYEDGFYDAKCDWEVGVSYTNRYLTASLAYVDTNYSGIDEAGRLAAGGVVGSLTAEF